MSGDTNALTRTILCAVDDSPLASAVAYAAAGFALQLKASVTLIRSDPRARGSEIQQLNAQHDLEKVADRSIISPSGRRVPTRIVVTASPPAEAIGHLAAAAPPLMVVMGSRGRGRLRRSMFGSQALSMMRDTSLPLVIVPPGGPEIITLHTTGESYCHVGQALIPVDLGPSTPAQVAFAAALLNLKPCHGVLLHVSPEPATAEVRAELEALQAGLHVAGTVSTLLVQGDPRHVLRQMVASSRYGLVILGRDRHHAGALASDLLHDSHALIAVTP
ncbi:MAG: universal stress protein [Vicinamibacterales bacterium]